MLGAVNQRPLKALSLLAEVKRQARLEAIFREAELSAPGGFPVALLAVTADIEGVREQLLPLLPGHVGHQSSWLWFVLEV